MEKILELVLVIINIKKYEYEQNKYKEYTPFMGMVDYCSSCIDLFFLLV